MEGSYHPTVRNTVRAPGAPFARPRTGLSRKVSINRESSALRASVLDIAMEIGLGVNGAVTDWVYNNPINEEEEESVSAPSLTTGSSVNSDACSSTSSARFPYSPPTSIRSISSSSTSLVLPHKSFSPSTFSIPEESSSITWKDIESVCTTPTPPIAPSITFSDLPMQLPPLSVRIPAKLKKRRTDGYESESGYTSDAKSKKDKKEKAGKTSESSESNANDAKADAKARAKEEKELAKRQKEASRQRAKSFASKKSEKDVKAADSLASKGYETDAPTRKGFGKKKKSPDAGYETDGGHLSSGNRLKKAKTRFFGLGGRSSKPDLATNVPKPAPSIPLPLPIAEKFSTTIQNSQVEPVSVLMPFLSLDTDVLSTVPAPTSAPPSRPSLPSPSPTTPSGPSLASPSPTTPSGPPLASPSPTTPSGPPLASPSPTTPSGPLGRVKSASSKKDSLSEIGVRDSHISGESSGSSISNASTGFSQESKASKLKGFRFLSPSRSSAAPSTGNFPSISLPLTRATSPAPPDTGNNDANQSPDFTGLLSPDLLRSPKLYPITRRSVIQESRGRSPVSATTAPALLSPTSRSVSPALSNPVSPSVIISTPTSRPSSPTISRSSLLRPQTNLTVNTSHGLSPVSSKRLSRGRSPSPVPSSEWIVPSPSIASMALPSYANSATLPVPSPSIYSVYDIPPPSPPPNAPLPKVPNVTENDVEDDPFGVNGTSVIRTFSQPASTKDTSFLSRFRSQSGSNNNTKTSERFLAPTIRRLSKQLITASIISNSSSQCRSDDTKTEELRDDVSDDQELQDLLDRFISELSSRGDKHEAAGTALGRRKSSEALRNDGSTSSEPVQELDEDDNGDDAEQDHSLDPSHGRHSTLYYSDVEEDGADQWNGSIYSRASVMDPERSEETRARFVKRVEAMLDEAGIERGNKRDWDAVPPVPKLPEALAQSNLLTRQNQLKGAGPTSAMHGWI